MTAKEALKQIWRDTYPKACETWSVDILTKHWRVVEQALEELDELKEIISLFNKFNHGAVSKKGLNEEEYSCFKELSKKYNMYLYGVCKGSERE
jgi:hypothetical protein